VIYLWSRVHRADRVTFFSFLNTDLASALLAVLIWMRRKSLVAQNVRTLFPLMADSLFGDSQSVEVKNGDQTPLKHCFW